MGINIFFDLLPYIYYNEFMKTTIELSDSILRETKKAAKKKGTTMREIVETALRYYLRRLKEKQPEYRFENHSFKGEGVRDGIQEGKWEDFRSAIYEGRGG